MERKASVLLLALGVFFCFVLACFMQMRVMSAWGDALYARVDPGNEVHWSSGRVTDDHTGIACLGFFYYANLFMSSILFSGFLKHLLARGEPTFAENKKDLLSAGFFAAYIGAFMLQWKLLPTSVALLIGLLLLCLVLLFAYLTVLKVEWSVVTGFVAEDNTLADILEDMKLGEHTWLKLFGVALAGGVGVGLLLMLLASGAQGSFQAGFVMGVSAPLVVLFRKED